jgi:hypothetical protein
VSSRSNGGQGGGDSWALNSRELAVEARGPPRQCSARNKHIARWFLGGAMVAAEVAKA